MAHSGSGRSPGLLSQRGLVVFRVTQDDYRGVRGNLVSLGRRGRLRLQGFIAAGAQKSIKILRGLS